MAGAISRTGLGGRGVGLPRSVLERGGPPCSLPVSPHVGAPFGRNADLRSAVSQACGLHASRSHERPGSFSAAGLRRTARRLEVCDTADRRSALRPRATHGPPIPCKDPAPPPLFESQGCFQERQGVGALQDAGALGKRFSQRARFVFWLWAACLFVVAFAGAAWAGESLALLRPEAFAHHIQRFNSMENENLTNFVSNARSWEWLRTNVPFFECPDQEVEEIYYYRWWSFRKHLVSTPAGFVLTEFLGPAKWAGAFNTISCAAGHHLAEGRWLRDPRYLDDYIRFWLRGNDGRPQPHFHKFSSWFAAAVYDRFLAGGDRKFAESLIEDLASDYRAWERDNRLTNGLYWQFDVRDGMEESISGSRTEKNLRPTINSYMYGNARAIAALARLGGRADLAREFDGKAEELKRLVEETLWNPAAGFFEARRPDGSFSDAREELGFIPWCFELPSPGRESAWSQLMDPRGFRAPYGITTAERGHPAFRSHGWGKCEWDGAVWPFATSQTLTALANVLRDYPPAGVSAGDYFDCFLSYAHCQHFDGKPYVGEYLDEVTGQWLKGRQERSRYYNHSTFADLVITGLGGLRPRADEVLEVRPLVPGGVWDWFCLDGIPYHGRTLTIWWDKDGKRYGRGAGLGVMVDGQMVVHEAKLDGATVKLP